MDYKAEAKIKIYGNRTDKPINVKDIKGFHKGLDMCIPLVAKLLEEIDDMKLQWTSDIEHYLG